MKCLFSSNCGDTPATRGLCWRHYNMISRQVRAGFVTWDNLIKRGKAMPSRQHGTKSKVFKKEKLHDV